MFGNNPIRKQDKGDGKQLWIQEVFYSIQGEGPFMGRSALFVRFAGCNLQCDFCDTEFESSEWRPTLEELRGVIHTKLDAMSTNMQDDNVATDLIVLTGGEPFRQNLVPLVNQLLDDGFTVQVETAGTLSWPDFPFEDDACHIVVSPKTPKVHKDFHRLGIAWKYIIDEMDNFSTIGLPMYKEHTSNGKQIATPKLFNRVEIFVQPCDRKTKALNDANTQKALDIALRHGYRISLQMHKQLGVE